MSLNVYIYIHNKALPLFILFLKMAYVEIMVGEKRKHALVSHILQNQTKDPWRRQITQVDQDCAHMWKVDGRNGILLLWTYLSFIWITWGHGYIIVYLFFFFSWTFKCPNFFSTLGHSCVPIFFGSCFLGMPSFLFFLNSPCLIWRILERERERDH